VVAGSPGMEGAAGLAATAALRAGAGYVRLSVPGGLLGSDEPVSADEVVHLPIGLELLLEEEEQERFASMVVGPGFGTADEVADGVRRLVASPGPPTIVDGDGLTALAGCRVDGSARPLVLTPHDGEYFRLTGRSPGPDRMAAARSLAADTGTVILLKGPTTVVAAPDGRELVTSWLGSSGPFLPGELVRWRPRRLPLTCTVVWPPHRASMNFRRPGWWRATCRRGW
jgi:NAD(P)H-hydrate repair Nnr-like enzyme with NAD(P)H-hydrate dehydratase domain